MRGATTRLRSRQHRPRAGLAVTLGLALAAALAGTAPAARAADADDATRARDDRIAELERVVEVLAEELERTRAQLAVPEAAPLQSAHGLGPAASKVYHLTRGLSLGAYAEGRYTKIVADAGPSDRDRADFTRMVLYAGYKFTDRIVFNSEIEVEHADEIFLEFAHLDFLWRDSLKLRAGLLLLPMGFVNEIHEPPFYYGVNRPDVERFILPTTWRENGVGVFGSLFGDRLEYQAYAVNGFDATGFGAAGLRGGRQKGSQALAEHLAFVGSLDWYPLDELQLGGSVYYGKSGQNQTVSGVPIPDAPLHLFEVHAQYRAHGLHARGLFAMGHLGDAGALSAALTAIGPAPVTVGGEMLGVYGELAYDVLPLLFPDTQRSLEPFFRYEYYDTQRDVPVGFVGSDANEVEVHTVGFSFRPVPEVVLKADYRSRDRKGGATEADEVNLGIGLVF